MNYSDESYNLRIELDTKGCELSAGEIEKMETDLRSLRKLVATFPVSNLYITVLRHTRSNDYHVKTSLALPGRTMVTGERDRVVHPAFERCVRKLTKKVEGYKRRMQGEAEFSKQAGGTHRTLSPTGELEIDRLQTAVENGDYVEFRHALDAFDEPLHQRVGSWIQRYPEIESRLGEPVTIADIVEEVFLNAFEQFSRRQPDVPPGHWLEALIDPSVQALLQSPDEEFETVSFARSLMEEG